MRLKSENIVFHLFFMLFKLITDYAALNSQTEKLKSNIDATSSEIEAWKAKSAEQDVEILSLKKNLESSDEHRGKREDELNEKVIELEKKCTGDNFILML